MSLNFSAQQYESAFKPKRLGNWEVPKTFPTVPRCRERLYFKRCIASSRGHLRPELKNRKKNPFCNYIGTYQLPRRITKDIADKLARFPYDCSVLDDISKSNYPPCSQAPKGSYSNRDLNPQERFRNVVRKCVDEVSEGDVGNEARGSEFVRKVKKCIDINSKEKPQQSENLQKGLKDQEKKEETNKLASNMIQEVEDYMKEKDVKERELLGKDLEEAMHNKLDKKSSAGREKKLRKVVKDCIKENEKDDENAGTDLRTMKEKVKDCVKKTMQLKDNNKEDAFRDSVQKCIDEVKKGNEQNHIDTESNKKSFKDKVKKCIRGENVNPKETLRETVKECLKQHQSELEPTNKAEMKEKVLQCLDGKKSKGEIFKQAVKKMKENGNNGMRETVKECMQQYESDAKSMKKDDFRAKIKRCVKEKHDEENKFRQAVKDCIPDKMGNATEQKAVKNCAIQKVKENSHKEKLRKAVQECIKENTDTNKKTVFDKVDSKFKNAVKSCAKTKT